MYSIGQRTKFLDTLSKNQSKANCLINIDLIDKMQPSNGDTFQAVKGNHFRRKKKWRR